MQQMMAFFAEQMKQKQEVSAMSEIKDALHGLTDKLAKVSTGGGGGGGSGPDAADPAMLEAFFEKAGGDQVESNVSKVKVRQTKAAGVKGALDKLKEMQKGGGDGE